MDNRPIGVFDSGVGGLTVVKQVIKELPNEQIIYFGDTARVPYGNKSKEVVTKFSRQDIRFLLTQNVKAIIIACNTVSSNSMDILKNEFDIPLFGVVIPGVNEALKTTKNKKIGIIGTEATVRSGAYKKLILDKDKDITVYSKPCPLFVPLVEEGWTYNDVSKITAEKYLKELVEKDIDSIVLGCTHYPLLKQCIGEAIGEKIKLVDPAHATAILVKEYLEKNGMIRVSDEEPKLIFYLSDTTDKFGMICEKALKKVYSAQKIDIEKY